MQHMFAFAPLSLWLRPPARPAATISQAKFIHIYRTLKIGDFPPVRPILERYLNNLSDYRKNKYPANETAVNVANTHWRFAVDKWGYKPTAGDNTITG